MKNIKLVLAILSSIVIIFFLIISGYWLAEDSCLDDGLVWDRKAHRCRDDCLKWDPEYGCIQLTPDQVQIFKKCKRSTRYCVSTVVYQDICLNNQKAWNLDNQECRFSFQPQDCYKLSGNWQYPEICTAK